MDTKRSIMSEIETLAVNAIVSQPDRREEADAHFSAAAKKIVEKALIAVDLADVVDVCRRALTGAAIQDYDLLANLLTAPDFDHNRLKVACERAATRRATVCPLYRAAWLAKDGAAGATAASGHPTTDTTPNP